MIASMVTLKLDIKNVENVWMFVKHVLNPLLVLLALLVQIEKVFFAIV